MKWHIDKSGKTVTSGSGLYKIATSYSKGGWNVYTGQEDRRGYFVHFTPGVDRNESYGFVTEICAMFSGFKVCLKRVSRASAKSEKEVDRVVEGTIPEIARIVSGPEDEQTKADEVGRLFLSLKAACQELSKP